MDINPLSDVLENIFFHSVGWLLFCWWFPLLYKNILVWCSSICLLFLLFPLPGAIYPIKYCYKQCPKLCCLCFHLHFMVMGLTFKSLIHFEFILLCDVRWSSFILLHVSVQFSQHCILNKIFLAHLWACLLSVEY